MARDKRMNLFKISLTILVTLTISINTYAGVYTNELSKCLIDSTSTRDKMVLVKWIFSALSIHPVIKPMTSISKIQSEKINKNLANLFTRLFTESCDTEIKKALKYDGEVAIQESFELLGKIAVQELFSNSKVEKELSSLIKYFDKKKFKHLF